MGTHVLLIEDDIDILEIIRYYLTEDNAYLLAHAPDAASALAYVQAQPFDMILLDIMLPDLNGIDLCEKLREKVFCPILFISCIDDERTIVRALEMGGDDYLVKPFTKEMLRARMQANLRRMQLVAQKAPRQVEAFGAFSLDHAKHAVLVRGVQKSLSPIEYNLLRFLTENPNTRFTLTELYERIWNRPSLGDSRTVMVHIHNLRKKIEENPNAPQYIQSARGSGYAFMWEETAKTP